MDSILGALSPAHAVQVVAVLGVLSAIKALLSAFGNPDNKIVKGLSWALDFVGYNPKH